MQRTALGHEISRLRDDVMAKDAEIARLNALIELGAKKLTDFMGRCIEAETEMRDYDRELEAISRIVTDGPDTVDARHMAEQDLPVIRKRHAKALRLAGL